MIIRIEDTDGNFVCDVDLAELDIEKLLTYAMSRLQLEPNEVQYTLPLSENDITKLIQYSVTSILIEEIEKYKQIEQNETI